MATLTVQTMTEAGAEISFSAAAAGGDQFTNSSQSFLVVKNDDVSSVTVTVTAQNTSKTVANWGDLTKNDITRAVSAGAVAYIGPFPASAFTDSSGFVQITYSGVTSLTVAVLKLA